MEDVLGKVRARELPLGKAGAIEMIVDVKSGIVPSLALM
jgi:hypothetical protein